MTERENGRIDTDDAVRMGDVGHATNFMRVGAQERDHRGAAPLEPERRNSDREFAFRDQSGGEHPGGHDGALPPASM